MRNELSTDVRCVDGSCAAFCSGSACCGTNDQPPLIGASSPSPLYYYYWRQNARIHHRSISNWLGYTKWFFSWKDFIDEAFNSGQMTNPNRVYDPIKANTSVNYTYTQTTPQWVVQIIYNSQGYAVNFSGVENLIALEFDLAGISYGVSVGESMRTNSTVCGC